MKKFFALIMASAMTLSLVACGTDAAAQKEADNASAPAAEEQVENDDAKTYHYHHHIRRNRNYYL